MNRHEWLFSSSYTIRQPQITRKQNTLANAFVFNGFVVVNEKRARAFKTLSESLVFSMGLRWCFHGFHRGMTSRSG